MLEFTRVIMARRRLRKRTKEMRQETAKLLAIAEAVVLKTIVLERTAKLPSWEVGGMIPRVTSGGSEANKRVTVHLGSTAAHYPRAGGEIMVEHRQVVQIIKDEFSKHFDNEMRLVKMVREANLSQDESDYIWEAMKSHPHILNNIARLTPDLCERVVNKMQGEGPCL